MHIENTFSKISCLMTALCLAALLLPTAQADTKTVSGDSAGTFQRSFNSTTTQGEYALSSTFTGTDNIGGPHTGHQLLQFDFFTGPGCPSGYTRFALEPIVGALATANAVLTYSKGQLYLKTVQADGCMDFATGEYTMTTVAVIVDGTGKFAEASGAIESAISGQVLISPSILGNLGQFGAFESVQSGEISY